MNRKGSCFHVTGHTAVTMVNVGVRECYVQSVVASGGGPPVENALVIGHGTNHDLVVNALLLLFLFDCLFVCCCLLLFFGGCGLAFWCLLCIFVWLFCCFCFVLFCFCYYYYYYYSNFF